LGASCPWLRVFREDRQMEIEDGRRWELEIEDVWMRYGLVDRNGKTDGLRGRKQQFLGLC